MALYKKNKMKIALAALLALTPVSAVASPVPNHSQPGLSLIHI